jgi:hypothetical protein
MGEPNKHQAQVRNACQSLLFRRVGLTRFFCLRQDIVLDIVFRDGEGMALKVGASDSLGTTEDAEAWQAALQQLAHELQMLG